jgi:single-stranded-DNA-specific exonuclease
MASRLLVNRGITTPEEAHRFLHPRYDDLPDPLLLPDADAAVERIERAIRQKERIFIHGDYDVDGVTSAALWMRLLGKLGADVMVHVPHRRRDGYDMKTEFVQHAKAEGAKVILTCDCGIQRCDEVEEAREAGIDVIITDHHEPGPTLPRAIAVVNPHRADSAYPFLELSGVGVAFRLGEALCQRMGFSVDHYRRAYSDLAAVGTVADMMVLRDDNRVLVKYGLEALAETRKPGLQALMKSAGLLDKTLDADSVGYRIGPRLNAIGRVDDAKIALDLLLTKDIKEAEALAERLETANVDRRQEEDRILREAMEMLAKGDYSDSYCIVLAGENWNSGVVGIVAGRIKERTGRPTILLSLDPETGTAGGSARSIGPFNVKEALDSCSNYLVEYGGHAQAAGMRLSTENLPSFVEAVNQLAREQLTEADMEPCFECEVEIEPTQVTPALLKELCLFEPWGRGNHRPLFVSRNIRLSDIRRMGKESQHLKLRGQYDGLYVPDSVAWNVGDYADHLHVGDHVDLCYKPQFNTWNGNTSIQFLIEDIRPSDADEW